MTTTVRDLPSRYGAVAMTLHWLIAAAIIVNLYLGLTAGDLPHGDPSKMQMMWWHKSIGFLVLTLSVLRLVWRLVHPVPPSPKALPPLIRFAGLAAHVALYVLIITVPLAGWLMVSSGSQGHGTSFFGLFDWPAVPVLTSLPRSAAHPWHETFESAHVVLAWAMLILVPLHVLAGLYHHFIRKDNVLLRMLPGTKLRSGV